MPSCNAYGYTCSSYTSESRPRDGGHEPLTSYTCLSRLRSLNIPQTNTPNLISIMIRYSSAYSLVVCCGYRLKYDVCRDAKNRHIVYRCAAMAIVYDIKHWQLSEETGQYYRDSSERSGRSAYDNEFVTQSFRDNKHGLAKSSIQAM
jgi:hypothetical protein